MVYSKSCPLMRKHYSILTKVGNTNIRNINVYYQNTILYKVCLEKETVWTTVRWKTSSKIKVEMFFGENLKVSKLS